MEIRLGRLLHQSPERPEKETGGEGGASESGMDLVVPVFSVLVPVVRTKGPAATAVIFVL